MIWYAQGATEKARSPVQHARDGDILAGWCVPNVPVRANAFAANAGAPAPFPICRKPLTPPNGGGPRARRKRAVDRQRAARDGKGELFSRIAAEAPRITQLFWGEQAIGC